MNYWKILAALILVLVAVWAVCLFWNRTRGHSQTVALAGSAAWPMFRADCGNTGFAAVRGPDSAVLLWRSDELSNYPASGDVSPVIDSDGTLYCSCTEGLYAIRPDGSIAWQFKFPGKLLQGHDRGGVYSPAIGSDGTVLVATRTFVSDFPWPQRCGGRLYAFSPQGRRLWTYRKGAPLTSPLIDQEGRICLLTSGGSYGVTDLTVLSPSGRLVRKLAMPETESWGLSAIALKQHADNTRVYCASDRAVHMLEFPHSGEEATVLSQALGTHSWVPGVAIGVEPDVVYVLMNDGTLYQLDADSLAVNWRRQLDGNARANPALTGDALYVITKPQVNGASAGASGFWEHTPHILHRVTHTGEVVWSVSIPCEVPTAPAVDRGGRVYVTGFTADTPGSKWSSHVYCVLPDGQVAWHVRVPSSPCSPSSPVLGKGGTIYFYSDRVYAVGRAVP